MNQPLLLQPSGALQVPAIAPIAAIAGRRAYLSHPVKLSLVIPTYNERSNVIQLVEQLAALLDSVMPQEYELILVDDDSPDRTWELAQKLTNQYQPLKVMRRQAERGLSSAVVRGWQVSQGEILAVIDADLQHPPDVLLKLIKAISQGADLAVASRHVEGGGVSEWSIIRRFLSRGAQVVGLAICPGVVGQVSDPMSGYFMVKRQAIAGTILNPQGYKILLEIIGRGNIQKIAEVGYVFQERAAGASKVTWKQYIDYLSHLIKLRACSKASKPKQTFPTDRFLRYGLVGLSGVLIDTAILYLLSTQLGWGMTRSKIAAAEVAIISNFFLNDAWTFADLSRRQKGWSARFKRLLKFNTICSIGLVLGVLILNILYNLVFAQNLKYVSNLISIALVALWNFWIALKLNWRTAAVFKHR